MYVLRFYYRLSNIKKHFYNALADCIFVVFTVFSNLKIQILKGQCTEFSGSKVRQNWELWFLPYIWLRRTI